MTSLLTSEMSFCFLAGHFLCNMLLQPSIFMNEALTEYLRDKGVLQSSHSWPTGVSPGDCKELFDWQVLASLQGDRSGPAGRCWISDAGAVCSAMRSSQLTSVNLITKGETNIWSCPLASASVYVSKSCCNLTCFFEMEETAACWWLISLCLCPVIIFYYSIQLPAQILEVQSELRNTQQPLY